MMSVNSGRRKGRINSNSNKLGRSKFYSEKNMSCDGIYGNSKLMYAAASLVGCVVQIQVQNGTIFEGVLRTFSHQLDIVLETAHKVSPKCAPLKGISPSVSNLIASYPFEEGIFDKLVFKLSDVILLQACNVDVDYAVKDNFTDTAISKYNGQVKERELEPWEDVTSDSESALGLEIEDDSGMNGWDANDMFRTNAEKYGVKSSYDNSLQEYTVPLMKKDTEEYKMQEAKALKIAQEIETNSSYQSRIQLENGDEEDRFSAVVRPHDSIPTKYVLPHKRQNIPGIKRQQQVSVCSPIHGAPVHASNSNIPNPSVPYQPLLATPCEGGPMMVQSFSTSPPPSPLSSTSMPKTRMPVKTPTGDDTTGAEVTNKMCTEPLSAPSNGHPLTGPPPKMHCPPPLHNLPPRIERRRENEKKMAKQKGRTDEIEEFKKFSSNFKLMEEKDLNDPDEGYQATSDKVEFLANKMERTKIDKDENKSADVVKYSTLNPNAKEFVFNPNAKSFTPRSMSAVTSNQLSLPLQPPPMQPPQQRMQDQGPLMAVPHSQMGYMGPNMPQPIFTAMAPQYVMQATPVSMAITSPFAATANQAPRFRKVPLTMQPRHDMAPSVHVAAATGQPILAPAAIPNPLHYTSPPGVIHASAPQMNFVVGPRVVSPQPVGVIPTSHSVSYCDTSHLPTHLIMSAHSGAAPHSTSNAPHHSLQQGGANHHPPQSQTPVIHPSPSPVHQVPPPPHPSHAGHSQPPTPTAVIYPGQQAGPNSHGQAVAHALHHHHHHHHPGFPPGSPQPVVLIQQQHHQHHHHQATAAHHSLHHHHHMHAMQNSGGGMGTTAHLLPQMTLLPSAPTPPFVQQHP